MTTSLLKINSKCTTEGNDNRVCVCVCVCPLTSLPHMQKQETDCSTPHWDVVCVLLL